MAPVRVDRAGALGLLAAALLPVENQPKLDGKNYCTLILAVWQYWAFL